MSTQSRARSRIRSRLLAKRFGAALSFATVLAVPALAQADEPKKDCDPGSWFCGETQPPGDKSNLDKLPEKGSENGAGKTDNKTPPPVVVYQPPPPTVVVQPRDAPPAYYYVPRTAPPKKEWGLNLHLGGAMMGKGRDGNAGMALVGLGLRFRAGVASGRAGAGAEERLRAGQLVLW